MENTYLNNATKKNSNLIPEQETIDFILQYSKSLNVIKNKDFTFEINKN